VHNTYAGWTKSSAEARLDVDSFQRSSGGEHVMTIAISFVGGVLLGFRWRFAVLFPTMLLVGPALFALGGLSWATVGQAVFAMTAIQFGYLCGAAMGRIGTPQTTTGNLHGTIERQ
jgi:hypothetical protein